MNYKLRALGAVVANAPSLATSVRYCISVTTLRLIHCCYAVVAAEPPTYAESISGAVSIRDEDDDQRGTMGDMMFTPMYTYVYDNRCRAPPAYSQVPVQFAHTLLFSHPNYSSQAYVTIVNFTFYQEP